MIRFLLITLLSSFSFLVAEESIIDSRIESISLFKNGLAVVHREVKIHKPGVYVIQDVPQPVHGTYWVESQASVETLVTHREMTVPRQYPMNSNLSDDLSGLNVSIILKDQGNTNIQGRVIKAMTEESANNWNRDYRPQNNYWHNSHINSNSSPISQFLILETPEGLVYVKSSMISHIKVTSPKESLKHRQPVLVLNVKEKNIEENTKVIISYLTKGFSWAPSYMIELEDSKKLHLRQKAVIKNELADLENSQIYLISGFPNVEFLHVSSPLCMKIQLSDFFRQLSQQRGQQNHLVTQQVVMSNSIAPQSLPFDAKPIGEGIDLHYQPIGRHHLKEGDALALDTASTKTSYERVIEWIIPDTRRADGRYIQRHERERNLKKYEDIAWDTIRFKNPLNFPMTTAPAMITQDSYFLGQSTSFFKSPGEFVNLHVNKALRVRTKHSENEMEGTREIVHIAGDRHRKVQVKGSLKINHHRDEKLKLIIRRRFSGELIQANGNPHRELLEEGAYSVNPHNELVWEIELKAGEEKDFEYIYSVLIDD